MHEEQDRKLLNRGYRVIQLIWGVMVLSLGVYLVVCLLMEKNLTVNIHPDFPIETLKSVLYGVALFELAIAYFLRRYLLKSAPVSAPAGDPAMNHPAAARYTVIVLITCAIVESVGIYGVVLFLLSKDTRALYQLLAVSALAMVYFRPRMEELLELAGRGQTPPL